MAPILGFDCRWGRAIRQGVKRRIWQPWPLQQIRRLQKSRQWQQPRQLQQSRLLRKPRELQQTRPMQQTPTETRDRTYRSRLATAKPASS